MEPDGDPNADADQTGRCGMITATLKVFFTRGSHGRRRIVDTAGPSFASTLDHSASLCMTQGLRLGKSFIGYETSR
jgi:hypothetical protein